jgi:hypothetical protein
MPQVMQVRVPRALEMLLLYWNNNNNNNNNNVSYFSNKAHPNHVSNTSESITFILRQVLKIYKLIT